MEENKPVIRRRILITHQKIQLSLMIYVVAVCILALLFLSFNVSFWNGEHSEQTATLAMVLIPLAGMILFSGLIFYGLILTNRICGPIFRVQREIKSALAGEPVRLIKLRPNDDFQDLIEDFNQLMVNQKLAPPETQTDSKSN